MTLICGEDEMAITKRFRQMTYDAVKFGRSVYTDPVSSAMHGLNALYESLWSVAAPGASSQSIFGHNHASGTSVAGPGGAGGGGALCRGLVWGADGGETPLFEFEAASAETSIFLTGSLDKIGRVPISQGLDRNKYLVADVYYSASNSDFDFDIYERSLETRGFAAAKQPSDQQPLANLLGKRRREQNLDTRPLPAGSGVDTCRSGCRCTSEDLRLEQHSDS